MNSSLAVWVWRAGCGVAMVAALTACEDRTRTSAGTDPERLLALVSEGQALPIVVAQPMLESVEVLRSEYRRSPSEFKAATRASADLLADMIEKISGVRPAVIEGQPEPVPERAIWVGYQPVLADLFPALDFDFKHPEEILLAANDRHVVIAGRDRPPGEGGDIYGVYDHIENETIAAPIMEYGTANAVSVFLQRHLGVRWLWPGDLGEDVIRSETPALEPFVYRFHPPLRGRRFQLGPRYYRQSSPEIEAVNRWWEEHHRAQRRSSLVSRTKHHFEDWWDRYHEDHPAFFALRPAGTRTPDARPRNVKLCISNPEVAETWLDEAGQMLRENPNLYAVSAAPTDGGGWCVCEDCRAWDHPDAPPGALTDRYVRFWNRLARGLRAQLPDRDFAIGISAYSVNRTPPLGVKLEPDVFIVSTVPHFPFNRASAREIEKAQVRAWSEMRTRGIWYRPNQFWYTGGAWALPNVDLERTIEDYRYVAELGAIGVNVDSVRAHFSTQAPQLYAMAQLAYDPFQDGAALMDDFFRRGFGPAAEPVRAYFELMTGGVRAFMELPEWSIGMGRRYNDVQLTQRIYTPELLEEAVRVLDEAAARAAGVDGIYADRVAFVRAGLDFVSIQMRIIPLMDRVRQSAGRDRDAVRAAARLSAERDALLEAAPAFAFDVPFFQDSLLRGALSMIDHLGPPSEAFIEAAAETEPRARLAKAEHWREVFHDAFERAELGPDWAVLAGDWTLTDGHLVSAGSEGDRRLMLTRDFPGLHRVSFRAMAIGETGVGDLSAGIHAAPDDPRAGYMVQFGGLLNSVNRIARAGQPVESAAAITTGRIEPGQWHDITAEFAGRHVRLVVDGSVLLEYAEGYPLTGAGHERVSLYFYTPVRIESIRVYTADIRAADYYDQPDME